MAFFRKAVIRSYSLELQILYNPRSIFFQKAQQFQYNTWPHHVLQSSPRLTNEILSTSCLGLVGYYCNGFNDLPGVPLKPNRCENIEARIIITIAVFSNK